ncbi:MAG: hypothetical protein JOZ56_05240 [Actinobacteria bacterium]|nr:hypothetical protein [Actinomycetota bacterium]
MATTSSRRPASSPAHESSQRDSASTRHSRVERSKREIANASRPSFVAVANDVEASSQTAPSYSAGSSCGVAWTTSPLASSIRNRSESPARSPPREATTQRPFGAIDSTPT